MAQRICMDEACEVPARTRGLCKRHYEILRRTGQLHLALPPSRRPPWGDLTLDVLRDGRSDDECWEWRGSRDTSGYGAVTLDGKRSKVHRVSYELAYGLIPEGLQIDHLCRVRACCNPAHLEAVTASENVRRGLKGVLGDPVRRPLGEGDVPLCVNGHEVTEDNAYPAYGKPRAMACRQCKRVWDNARKAEAAIAAGREPHKNGRPVTAPCGTASAYARHKRRGEEPCDPCRDARREYQRELWKRRASA